MRNCSSLHFQRLCVVKRRIQTLEAVWRSSGRRSQTIPAAHLPPTNLLYLPNLLTCSKEALPWSIKSEGVPSLLREDTEWPHRGRAGCVTSSVQRIMAQLDTGDPGSSHKHWKKKDPYLNLSSGLRYTCLPADRGPSRGVDRRKRLESFSTKVNMNEKNWATLMLPSSNMLIVCVTGRRRQKCPETLRLSTTGAQTPWCMC